MFHVPLLHVYLACVFQRCDGVMVKWCGAITCVQANNWASSTAVCHAVSPALPLADTPQQWSSTRSPEYPALLGFIQEATWQCLCYSTMAYPIHEPSSLFRICNHPNRSCRSAQNENRTRKRAMAYCKPKKQMGIVKQEKEKSLQQTTHIQVTRTMHQSNRGRAQTVEPGRWAQACTAAMDEVSRSGNTWKHLIIPT